MTGDSQMPITIRGTAQQRSRMRREQIVQATIELISNGGPKVVTHRAVSARAGLPPATAGYYFNTVDELIEAALRRFATQRVQVLTAMFDEAMTADTGLIEIADRIAQALVHGAAPQSLAQYEVYLEAARNPRLRDAVSEAMAAFEQVAVDRLRLLGWRSPRLAAKAFVAAADGFALHRLAAPVPLEEDLELMRLTITGLYFAFASDEESREKVAEKLEQRR